MVDVLDQYRYRAKLHFRLHQAEHLKIPVLNYDRKQSNLNQTIYWKNKTRWHIKTAALKARKERRKEELF